MLFCDKLKYHRTLKGETQDECAKGLGITRRRLCYYEDGTRYPRDRAFYDTLADYFGVDKNYFLTENEMFMTEAAAKYGTRGLAQARVLMAETTALFAGGELPEEDMEAFIRQLQEAYFDSKERAKKFTPNKYRKADDETP